MYRSLFAALTALVILWCNEVSVYAQKTERGDLRLMFYNVENYFDASDDSLTADEEFLPHGDKNWDDSKCWKKANQIFKTIAAVGTYSPPEIVAFAEIENQGVLQRLTRGTPLSKYPYRIVHYDSPDFRGIDVGLIFREDMLQLISSAQIAVTLPGNTNRKTRDILYASFIYSGSDTLHFFVNHWPSRRGGVKASEPNRKAAANILRRKTDSLLLLNSAANIIITGDFNDEPFNESISRELRANSIGDQVLNTNLYNLSANLKDSCECGTYRYRADWNMLDQFMVSGALLDQSTGIYTCPDCMYVARLPFLLEEDLKYGGYKPKRTYRGPVYLGGYSDHLPIYLDLFRVK